MRTRTLLVIALFATLMRVAADAWAFSDPTQPMNFAPGPARSTPAAPAGPVLQSTQISAEHRAATISGKRVRVGDVYDGARITSISQYEVRMQEKGGRETVLRLFPKLTKEQGAVQ